jgi:two-component system, OmpR family, heavy metal sensor histidine kinase CusS
VLRRLGLAWRLAGGFALIGGLTLLATGYYLDHALREDVETRVLRDIDAKIAAIVDLLRALPNAQAVGAQRARFEEVLIGHDDLALVIGDARGERLISTAAVAEDLLELARRPATTRIGTLAATIDDRPFLVRTASTKIASGETVTVALGIDMTRSQATLDAHWRRVVNVWLLGIAALTAAAWFTARLGLAPLRDMAERARGLTATRLSGRLPTTGVPNEVAAFAGSFNGALERLEESFARLSQFSADLAHDLRTPIANLRGEAEVALAKARSPAEYQDVLGSAIEEYERMNSMIEAMLFLARADNADVALNRERFDVAAEARSLVEYFEPLADSRHTRCRVEGAGEINADRALIRRAIANLLSNAVRHADPHSEIAVRVMTGADGGVELQVENAGPTIPAALHGRVFDRFYRGDAARTDSGSRSGLGLAIVKSIVTMHQGTATVATTAQGRTRFSLSMPAG